MVTSKLDTLPPASLSSNNLILTAYHPHTNKKLNQTSKNKNKNFKKKTKQIAVKNKTKITKVRHILV